MLVALAFPMVGIDRTIFDIALKKPTSQTIAIDLSLKRFEMP